MQQQQIVMTMYVVYRNPRDQPWRYVVRQWYIMEGLPGEVPEREIWEHADDDTGLWFVREKLERMGLCCLPRAAADDPAILEVWV